MDISDMPVWKVDIWGTLKGIEIHLSDEVRKKRKRHFVIDSCGYFRRFHNFTLPLLFAVERSRNAATSSIVSRDIRTEFAAKAQTFNAMEAKGGSDVKAECEAVDECAAKMEGVEVCEKPMCPIEAECPPVGEGGEVVKKVQPNGDGIPEKVDDDDKMRASECDEESDSEIVCVSMRESQMYRDGICEELEALDDKSDADVTVRASSETDVGTAHQSESEQPSVLTQVEEKHQTDVEYHGDDGTAV